MTTRYGAVHTGVLDGTKPPLRADGALSGGKRRTIRETFDLSTATFASGDVLTIGKLPIGAHFAGGRIIASATMGATATIAIGKAGATAKYRAAAVHTTVDQPVTFGLASAFVQAPLTAPETVIATIAAAALPAAGTLVIEVDYLITA